MRKLALAFLLLLALQSCVVSAQADYSASETVVVVNSNQWQDAMVAAQYAAAKGYKFKFIIGTEELGALTEEVYGLKVNNILLFERRANALPALSLSLRSLGVRLKETSFTDHNDLAGIVLREISPEQVVLVRSDFAFDAISATYLTRILRVLMVFADGTGAPKQELLFSLRQAGVRKVIAVGALRPEALDALKPLEVVPIAGRDEYETTRLLHEYAFKIKSPGVQSIITTGDIIESTVLFPSDYPIYVVPETGTYSLPQLAALLNKTRQTFIVGVGQSVFNAGEWLKQTMGVRFVAKISRLRPPSDGSQFVRKDVLNVLHGYAPPLPNYSFEIVSVQPIYSDLLGFDTGRTAVLELVDQVAAPKTAPPVTIKAIVANRGNIELPMRLLFTVLDSDGNPVTTIRSDTVFVGSEESRVVAVKWPNPPSEGNYVVRASAFADVYEGITSEVTSAQFELRWLIILLNVLLLLVAVVMSAVIAYFSHAARSKQREARSLEESLGTDSEGIVGKIQKGFKQK